MSDDLKIRMPEWARNMYNRLVALINAGGGGGGGEARINSISLNGVNVPPDANKNVALVESDPTVPSWAKQSSKPTYTAQEVGALPASTPIPSKTSDLTNDSGFLTSSTGVTGVKGNAESAYRHGNVNLTPANIGAVGTGDIIDAQHGGTGATTVSGALANLGFTPVGEIINSQYFAGISVAKSGSIAELNIHDPTGIPSGSYIMVGTIPVGYRPRTSELCDLRTPNGAQTIRIILSTTGEISVYNYSTNTGVMNISGTMVYITAQ